MTFTVENTHLDPVVDPMDSHIYEKGLVSVIIPTYNHAHYIRDAIQSVLNQTYPHYEMIVVDDGSKDPTRDVVAEFGSAVQYIWQENQGLSAARNTGIRASKGEFIGVLDADDMYEPEYLRLLVNALNAAPELGGIYCGFQFVDSHNQLLSQVGNRVIEPENLFTFLLGGNFLVPECVLVRRACYQKVGLFDITLRACEDWDMWLRVSQDFKVIGSNVILTRHRVLPGSMSSDPKRMLTSRLAVLEKLFGQKDAKLELGNDYPKRAYSDAYLASALEYLQYQDPDKAYECLRQSVHDFPDVLHNFSLYYELGCGSQPKGMRGNFNSIDLHRNSVQLLSFLERLLDDPELAPLIGAYRRQAFANAFYALGLLSYGANQFSTSRDYLMQSLRYSPAFLFKKPFAILLLKTLLGKRLVARFRQGFLKTVL